MAIPAYGPTLHGPFGPCQRDGPSGRRRARADGRSVPVMHATYVNGITIRPLRNGDVATVLALFGRLGERARASRFCGAKPRLTDAELDLLARVDANRHVLVGYVDGDPRPAGIAQARPGRRERRDRPERGGRAPRPGRGNVAARGARRRCPCRRDHVLRGHRVRRQPVHARHPAQACRPRSRCGGSGASARSSSRSAPERTLRRSRTALPSARAAPAARRGRCGTRSACPCSSSPRRASPRAGRRAARAS